MVEILQNLKILINGSLVTYETSILKLNVRSFYVEGRVLVCFNRKFKKGDNIKVEIEFGEFSSYDSDEGYSFCEFKLNEKHVGVGINSSYPEVCFSSNGDSLNIDIINKSEVDLCITWKTNKSEEDLSLWYLSDKNFMDLEAP